MTAHWLGQPFPHSSYTLYETATCDTLPVLLGGPATGTETRWRPVLITKAAATRLSAQSASQNDFLVSVDMPRTHSARLLEQVQSYLAGIFGQRRSYLFAPGLAVRIHSVFLPPGVLVPRLEEAATVSWLCFRW